MLLVLFTALDDLIIVHVCIGKCLRHRHFLLY